MTCSTLLCIYDNTWDNIPFTESVPLTHWVTKILSHNLPTKHIRVLVNSFTNLTLDTILIRLLQLHTWEYSVVPLLRGQTWTRFFRQSKSYYNDDIFVKPSYFTTGISIFKRLCGFWSWYYHKFLTTYMFHIFVMFIPDGEMYHVVGMPHSWLTQSITPRQLVRLAFQI